MHIIAQQIKSFIQLIKLLFDIICIEIKVQKKNESNLYLQLSFQKEKNYKAIHVYYNI